MKLINRRGGQRGFTLVELLIVVAIIGVLASFGLGGAFLSSRRRATDAARRGDIKAIQTALEQYFVVKGFYPNNLDEFKESVSGSSEFLPQPIEVQDVGDSISNQFPYGFASLSNSDYCVCALLSASKPNGNSSDTSCDSLNIVEENSYFCLPSMQ